MICTVTEENLESINSCWNDPKYNLNWSSVFVLPPWLKTWWQVFGKGYEIYIRSVKQVENILGIAPLMKKGETVYFMGSTDVCDYMDFVFTPGSETDFFDALLGELKEKGIKRLDLAHVRPDSSVMTCLKPMAQDSGYSVDAVSEETSLEVALPSDWDEYLLLLTGKQRHEVRRKLRRLAEAGHINYKFIKDSASISEAMDTFIMMFKDYREDKAIFLTGQMESFFRLLADNMSGAGISRLGILELDDRPIACIMCFDYNDCVYLYNSGYNPEYNHLSAGLMSKVLAVQDSIRRHKKVFDFLKGAESYKYHLGGKEVPLYRCMINIK